jgi:hypothetical protein
MGYNLVPQKNQRLQSLPVFKSASKWRLGDPICWWVSVAGCSKEMKDKWFSLTPMRLEAEARELKGIYLYLASDACTFTTGTDIMVDGRYCWGRQWVKRKTDYF